MTALGFLLLFLLLYTYVGYPLLVTALSRALPHRVESEAGFEPHVSVCIAVHNGSAFLRDKLASIQALDYPRDRLEILIYSDGSTDDTEELLRSLAAQDPRLKVLANPQRLGKPTGLNQLRGAARGEVLLMTDVRQKLAPCALRALLAPLSDPRVGCVSGCLMLLGNTGAGAYWRYEKFIRSAEARLGGMVGVSGSLYAIRRHDFHELPSDLLLDDMFVPLVTAGQRKRVLMSREAEAYDHACSDEQEFSRKVRTLAGNYQLIAKLPWLLVPFKNPVWFQLCSHKFLRLICPFALLGLLVSSASAAFSARGSSGERSFWAMLTLAQLVFYALAALDARAGRIGSLARTFVVLNAAAVVGLWRFLRKSQQVAW